MSDKPRSTGVAGTSKPKKPAKSSARPRPETDEISRLVAQYTNGPIQLTGGDNALYERHLTFDDVVAVDDAGPRERYEAFARSIRDVLSQRWIQTTKAYDRQNPKRVYYLSMEFLIGRSLANNIANLTLDAHVAPIVQAKHLDWLDIVEREPDAGLGNGGLGRLAACFLDSMATLGLPAVGYGLRYEYGIFSQSMQDGWQHERPDNWLRRQDPWEVARPNEQVEVRLGCSFEMMATSRAGDASETCSLEALVSFPSCAATSGASWLFARI